MIEQWGNDCGTKNDLMGGVLYAELINLGISIRDAKWDETISTVEQKNTLVVTFQLPIQITVVSVYGGGS